MRSSVPAVSGSITVFFCLVCLLILSLLLAGLESARSRGLDYRMRSLTASSLQSVFAEYDDLLWGQYRLLFADAGSRGPDLLQARMLEYACRNTVQRTSGLFSDWYRLEPQEAQVTGLVFATDQNGAVFEAAVLNYMKSGAVSILLDEVKDGIGLTGQPDFLREVRESADKGEFSLEEAKRQIQETETQAVHEAESKTPGGGETAPDAGTGSSGAGSGQLDPELLAAGEASRREGITSKSILEALGDLLVRGVLAAVLDDPSRISKAAYGGSNLPSQLGDGEKSRHDPQSPVAASGPDGSMGSALLINEYIIRFLDNYRAIDEREDSAAGLPLCQAEYVIAGKNSDYDNLAAVVNRILWIRAALNGLYLLTDQEKFNEARAAAVAIIGWTGMMPAINLVAGLLLICWAFGEAITDVRDMLQGHRVPLLKDSETWRLSLKNLVTSVLPSRDEEKEQETGLSYEDYLRIFLFFTDARTRDYRTMDMIQRAVMVTEPGFSFCHCVYACQGELTARGNYLFSFPSMFGISGQGYLLNDTTEYSYRERQG